MAGLVVAMIGQRDLPATYGEIERHVEELAARLHDRGHRATAFTSDHAGPREHRGVRPPAAHGLPLVPSDIPAHRGVMAGDGPRHRLVPLDESTGAGRGAGVDDDRPAGCTEGHQVRSFYADVPAQVPA